MARGALGEVLLQEMLADHQDRRDDQVPGGGDEQHRHRQEQLVGDVRGAAVELGGVGHRDDQRGGLQQRDELVARRRDDDAHRLGQHRAADGLAPAHAQGLRRLRLALRDRLDAGADDFGHVGGLVEAQAQHGEQERVLQRRLQVQLGEADVDGAVDGAQQAPEDQLDVDRGAAEDPQVDPRNGRQHRVVGHAQHRDERTADDADEHRQDRQGQRVQRGLRDAGVQEVLEVHVPVVGLVAGGADDEPRGQRQQDGGADPPARVGQRLGLDGRVELALGRLVAGAVGRLRHRMSSPLMRAWSTAPSSSPHMVRMRSYSPVSMRCCNASASSGANSESFGTGQPKGAPS